MSGPLFEKSKSMHFPREVYAGHDALVQIKDIAKDIKGPAIIVTGEKTYKAAGATTEEYLKEEGFRVSVIEVGSASRENLEIIRKEADAINPGFMVGVGGGSKIDLGKLVAHERKVRYISVPTSAAHDGLSSPMVSIREETGKVTSINTDVPYAIIADTGVIHKAPYRMLAAGCADVVSNLTALMDWNLAARLYGEEISTTAIALAEMSARTIMKNASTISKNIEEGVWVAIKPIIASGLSMGIAGSSRPASGAEHMFSHALDRLMPEKTSLHGEQAGIGTIVSMYLHDGDWRGIKKALENLKSPTTAKELGIPSDIMISALVEAKNIRKRVTILGKGLTEESAEVALSNTGII